jgi:hypothetical protein
MLRWISEVPLKMLQARLWTAIFGPAVVAVLAFFVPDNRLGPLDFEGEVADVLEELAAEELDDAGLGSGHAAVEQLGQDAVIDRARRIELHVELGELLAGDAVMNTAVAALRPARELERPVE